MHVRKNAATLTADEWTRYMTAVVELKHSFPAGSNVSIYDQFVAIHLAVTQLTGAQTVDGAHRRPGFLPWHREYLRRYERALQSVDPKVTLPYWNWGSDITDTTSLFTDDRIGPMGSGGPSGNEVATGYLAFSPNAFNPMGWSIALELVRYNNTLQRGSTLNTGAGFPTGTTVSNILSQGDFASFRSALEQGPHNSIHGRVGRDMGQMTSPNDPIFFMHHAQVDHIWAKWQEDHPGSANYNPMNNGGQGHKLNDSMWPWDNGASSTTIAAIAGLLPTFAATDVVTPADVLDHHALDYCYDDEPGCPCNLEDDTMTASLLSAEGVPDFTTFVAGEEGPIPSSLALGEEGPFPTTFALGEEGTNPSTLAFGEEGPSPSTLALGEEGGFGPNPRGPRRLPDLASVGRWKRRGGGGPFGNF